MVVLYFSLMKKENRAEISTRPHRGLGQNEDSGITHAKWFKTELSITWDNAKNGKQVNFN